MKNTGTCLARLSVPGRRRSPCASPPTGCGPGDGVPRSPSEDGPILNFRTTPRGKENPSGAGPVVRSVVASEMDDVDGRDEQRRTVTRPRTGRTRVAHDHLRV